MAGVTPVAVPNKPRLPEEFTPTLPHMSNTRSFWVRAVLVLAMAVFLVTMAAGVRPGDTGLAIAITIVICMLLIGVSMSILGERTSKADHQRYVYRSQAQDLLDQLHSDVTSATDHARHMLEELASCHHNERLRVLKALITAKERLGLLLRKEPLPPLVLAGLNLRREEIRLLAEELEGLRTSYCILSVEDIIARFDTLPIAELKRRYEELLLASQGLHLDTPAWGNLKDSFHTRLAGRIARESGRPGNGATTD